MVTGVHAFQMLCKIGVLSHCLQRYENRQDQQFLILRAGLGAPIDKHLQLFHRACAAGPQFGKDIGVEFLGRIQERMQERRLALEIKIDGTFGQARLGGNEVYCGVFITSGDKQP